MMKLKDAQRLGGMLFDLGFTPILQEMGDGYIIKLDFKQRNGRCVLRIANRLAIIQKSFSRFVDCIVFLCRFEYQNKNKRHENNKNLQRPLSNGMERPHHSNK